MQIIGKNKEDDSDIEEYSESEEYSEDKYDDEIRKYMEISSENNPKYLNEYGDSEYERGNYDESLEIYKKCFEIDPENTRTIQNLAFIYDQKKEYKMAQKYFNLGVQICVKNNLYCDEYSITCINEQIQYYKFKK